MHVFIVVAIGVALFQPGPTHTCITPYAAPGTRVELVNAENHLRSWCAVVAGRPHFGSIIDVDAVVREELAMRDRAFLRVSREISAPASCSRSPVPQTCVMPTMCGLTLPTPTPCPR